MSATTETRSATFFFPSRQSMERLEGKSVVVLDVEEATGRPRLVAALHVAPNPRIGLFVGNNPVNAVDPLGLWIDVPDSMRDDYNRARGYLAGSAAGDILNALDQLPQRIELRRGLGEESGRFSPMDNSITWDPRLALSTPDGRGLSPAVIFGHEADHALAFNTCPEKYKARTDPKTGALGGDMGDKEERRVIWGSENTTARAKGEGIRKDHTGDFYPTSGVTSRKRLP
jgi:hypothetical protein